MPLQIPIYLLIDLFKIREPSSELYINFKLFTFWYTSHEESINKQSTLKMNVTFM